MFKLPKNQEILEFIAQHINVEVMHDVANDGQMSKNDSSSQNIKPKGRNRFFTEISDFNKLRGRVERLVPLLTSQMAMLSSDNVDVQKQCSDHVFKMLRMLECVYNSIRQRPLYTLTEQPTGNLAMVELFLLPYLKRASHELNETYPNNFLFYYLKRYVDLIFVPLANPMATFISEHKRAFKDSGLSADTDFLSLYRKDRYKKLSAAIDDFSTTDTNKKLKFLGWHIAGNIIHTIIRACTDKNNGEWFGHKALLAVNTLEREYDVVYNKLLSLNATETVMNAIVSDRGAEVHAIANMFMTHVGGYELVDEFISSSTVKKNHRPLYKTLKEKQTFLYDFCQRVSHGETQSSVEVDRAQHALVTLYDFCHLGHDAFSFAHYIFIAKYDNGQAKINGALIALEQIMFESGVDPFSEIGLNLTLSNVDDINMTYAEHQRCRYVGYYNWLLKNRGGRYNFINPIKEVEQFLLSIIQPLELQENNGDREYKLVAEHDIVKQAWLVKNPCVGVMRFGLKNVIENLDFFKYVFQLNYDHPEEDSEIVEHGIVRYALLTTLQQSKLLELIPDDARQISNVDIALIPEL